MGRDADLRIDHVRGVSIHLVGRKVAHGRNSMDSRSSEWRH